MREEPDYYKVLQIDPAATAEELRQQHRKLVRALHPDRHASDPAYVERLTQVNAAFHELRDELRRSAYDRRRREAAARLIPPGVKSSRPKASYPPTPTRPMISPFTRKTQVFSMHPSSQRTRKRGALLGGLMAALLAVALVTVFFLLLSGNAQMSLLDIYNLGENAIAGNNGQVDNAALSKQYHAIQSVYEHRIEDIQAEADNTVAASNVDAASLDEVGDTGAARILRHDTSAYQTKIVTVTHEIHTLGQLRDFADEVQMESTLDDSLDDLRVDDRQLGVEMQNMRKNNTDVDSAPDPIEVYSSSPAPKAVSNSSNKPPNYEGSGSTSENAAPSSEVLQ
jgi:curved DNA-binding protein CbpA